jgi:hypothetical protein
MNKPANFEIAKLLKEKGFSWECSHFYSKDKYDREFYLRTGLEYDSDRDCIWDWNLNGGKSGMLSKIIPYPNDDTAIYYSAPTIADVVMWLYEKHGIWISVTKYKNYGDDVTYFTPDNERHIYKTPTEAYEARIKHTLENLI